jgi:hypothetical protein
MEEATARVIFGGMNRQILGKKLRKLTARSEKSTEVDELLTQLDAIAEERNKLVHRIVEYDSEKGLKVSNYVSIEVDQNVENKSFGIAELGDLEDDSKRIFIRFGLLIGQLHNERMTQYGFTLLGLVGPWRYKRELRDGDVNARIARTKAPKRTKRQTTRPTTIPAGG